MRNSRMVLSGNSGTWIRCTWFDCDKPGYELYKIFQHEHDRSYPCEHPMAQHISFVFCSERHRQYFLNSHRDMGNLPAGHRSTL